MFDILFVRANTLQQNIGIDTLENKNQMAFIGIYFKISCINFHFYKLIVFLLGNCN